MFRKPFVVVWVVVVVDVVLVMAVVVVLMVVVVQGGGGGSDGRGSNSSAFSSQVASGDTIGLCWQDVLRLPTPYLFSNFLFFISL